MNVDKHHYSNIDTYKGICIVFGWGWLVSQKQSLPLNACTVKYLLTCVLVCALVCIGVYVYVCVCVCACESMFMSVCRCTCARMDNYVCRYTCVLPYVRYKDKCLSVWICITCVKDVQVIICHLLCKIYSTI